jgi:hypothetical protein
VRPERRCADVSRQLRGVDLMEEDIFLERHCSVGSSR